MDQKIVVLELSSFCLFDHLYLKKTIHIIWFQNILVQVHCFVVAVEIGGPTVFLAKNDSISGLKGEGFIGIEPAPGCIGMIVFCHCSKRYRQISEGLD